MIESRPTLTPLYPLEAQLLPQFTPSEQTTAPLNPTPLYPLGSAALSSFYPPPEHISPKSYTPFLPWQLNSYLILPPLNNEPPPLTLIPFCHLGSPALSSFYALWSAHAQLLHHFTPWKPKSYLNLPPLNKLPPPPLLHHFTPLAAQLLIHFNLPQNTTAPTPTPLFSPWQLNSYLILPPLNNNPPPLTLIPFCHLGSPALSSFYALWSNHAQILHHSTPWKLNSYLNLPPLNQLSPLSPTLFYPIDSAALSSF